MTAALTAEQLKGRYEQYLDTLNAEAWSALPDHLEATVNHNGNMLNHDGYRQLIPAQTHFSVADIVVDAEKRQVAVRLYIAVATKHVTEHVFYHFSENYKIDRVWSLVQDGQVTG
jgi:predicted ester cyclase